MIGPWNGDRGQLFREGGWTASELRPEQASSIQSRVVTRETGFLMKHHPRGHVRGTSTIKVRNTPHSSEFLAGGGAQTGLFLSPGGIRPGPGEGGRGYSGVGVGVPR